jgi:hypothetical protein
LRRERASRELRRRHHRGPPERDHLRRLRLWPRDDENPDDYRRAYSDETGELLTFCRECAEREFGGSD